MAINDTFPRTSPSKPGTSCDTSLTATPKSCLCEDGQSYFRIRITAALDFYEDLMQKTASLGINVNELLATLDSNLDWRQYIPCDGDGQLMSLGSIPHLAEPCGTKCRPCGWFQKGKCYKLEQCTYCHFWHPKRSSRSDPEKKESSIHRRERRKRNAHKKYEVQVHSDDYVQPEPHVTKQQSATPNCDLNSEQPCPSPVAFPEFNKLEERKVSYESPKTCITPPPEELEFCYGIHPDVKLFKI